MKKLLGKRGLAAVSLAFVSALTISACGSEASTGALGIESFEEMDAVTLNVGTIYGPDNWQTTPLHAFAEEVEEATEGKVNFEFYYAGSLVPPAEIADGLSDGIIDIGTVIPSYSPATYPVDTWVSNFGFAPTSSPVAGTLQGAAANIEWGFENEEYFQNLKDSGLQPLIPRVQSSHTYNLLCKDDASTLDAIDGKRVRVGGEAWSKEVTALGMVPVDMPAAEVYQAFQQGLLECFNGSVEDIDALGLSDHGEYFTAAGMTGWTSYALAMGQGSWDRLPSIAQDALWDALPTYVEGLMANNMDVNLNFADENNDITFDTPDGNFKKAIEDYHLSVIDNQINEAPSAISDPQATQDSYFEIHDRWLEEITGLGYDAEATSWAEYVDTHGADAIELTSWADAVKSEILDNNRPE